MSGKQQHSDETYQRAADMYRAGARLKTIQAACEMARNSVYTACKKLGVPVAQRKRGAARTVPDEALNFDHFKPVAKGQCACGACGIEIVKIRGQRTRKWAIGCPNRAEIDRLKAVAYHRSRWEKRAKVKAFNPPANGSGCRPPMRDPILWCRDCCGISDRRPLTGCKLCGMPYAEETFSEAYHDMSRRSR